MSNETQRRCVLRKEDKSLTWFGRRNLNWLIGHIESFSDNLQGADFTFLMNQTGLTRGNLSTHLDKLAEEGYIEVTKTFENGKIPRTLVGLTEAGRLAVRTYRENMRQVIDELLG